MARPDPAKQTNPLVRRRSRPEPSQIFKAAVRKVGLPECTTTHDLRHHYASVLLLAGESVVAVAERLGHQNANLVLSTYGHLMSDSEERTHSLLSPAPQVGPVPVPHVSRRARLGAAKLAAR